MPLSSLVVLPLLIIAISLASLFKSKIARLTIIFVLTIFIVMELTSIYFSGGFIDYQFFINLNINDIIEGLFIFKWQAAFVVAVFLVLVLVLYLLAKVLRSHCFFLWRIMFAILATVSLGYSPTGYPNSLLGRLEEIYKVTSAPFIPFQQSLQLLNITDYVYKNNVYKKGIYKNGGGKDQLQSQAGKNIVVISLESFEQGFLDQKELTPNLNQLSQNYTFFPHMPMSLGSSWTAASMYTYMTGMPFLVGGFTTKPLAEAKATQLVSLGDVLQTAGYQTRYVIGGPSFAGIGHLINLLGIDVISEENLPPNYPKAPFGLYDKDIFAIAKNQVAEMQQTGKPFALFISTVSTHAPNGFRDNRMQKLIAPQADDMSFAAASLDFNLGQFIRQLKDEGVLENTVFYIFPDHLMMGAATPTIERLSQKERLLYLLTNATEYDLQKSVEQTIYQIDLPRLILNGAQVMTNAKFLTDYLSNTRDKKLFVQQHKKSIATINRSAALSIVINK
ncbi:LTA synthase family protein [Orbaceae bacterium ESL0727]|nr:LTA synthase family protein [Orbaceae bacterium ESL0727]